MLATFIYLLISISTEVIDGEVIKENPPKNLIPNVTHKMVEDLNYYLEYTVNHIDRDFIIFLSKEEKDVNTGKSKIYLSDDGGISLRALNLSTNESLLSVDNMQSTKDYMFFISYLNSRLAYIDKSGRVNITQTIVNKASFTVHPNFPNLIVKGIDEWSLFTKEISISTDFGNTFSGQIKSCSIYRWAKSIPYLGALCDQILYSIECSSDRTLIRSKIPKINSILFVDDVIFAISINNDGKGDVLLLNVTSQQQQLLEFPNVLNILQLIMGRISNEYIYIVGATDKVGSCVFISRVEERRFIRLMCELDKVSMSENSCPFYVTKTEGLLYVNKLSFYCLKFVTYISRNNGNSWVKAQLPEGLGADKRSKYCVKLDLPCNDLNPHGKSIQRFEVLTGEYGVDDKRYRGHFFTYDWGHTWSFVPNIKSDLISINMGYVLVGVNELTHMLQYTLDEGHTWYSTDIFDKSERIISEVSSDSTDKDFLIVVGQNDTNEGIHWIFSTVDFRNILNRKCIDSDYHEVVMPHAHTRCFRGKETFCFHKLNTSLCLHPNDDERCHQENSCPCTSDDFECSFGYVFRDEQCIEDRFHEKQLEEDPCADDHVHMVEFRGYRKIRNDQCKIKDIDFEKPENSSEYCRNLYHINFVYIMNSDKFIRIDISNDGKIYIKSKAVPLHLDVSFFKFTSKIDINYHSVHFYHSVDKNIQAWEVTNLKRSGESVLMYRHTFDIDQILYDSVSNSIIFNDISHQLYIVSLRTSFKKLLISYALNLTFYEKKRAISYFTNDKKFCYYHLYQSSSCIPIHEELKNAKYDEEYHQIFFHFKNQSLVIFSNHDHASTEGKPLDTDNIKMVIEIPNIEYFDFIGQQLYYIKDSKLLNLNLNHLDKTNLVHSDIFTRIVKFGVHQFSVMSPYDDCVHLECSYLCEFSSDQVARCICPPNSTLVKNKCVCDNNDNCLENLCMGFWCGNGVCTPLSSICDGHDDCGDGADEHNCKNTTKDKYRVIRQVLTVVIIGVVLVFVGWWSIRTYIRTKRLRISSSSAFIHDISYEFQALIQDDSEEK